MYNVFRRACERVLCIPHDPAPPPGDEASARVFRAAPAYFRYRLAVWAFTALAVLVVGLFIVGSIFLAVTNDPQVPDAVRSLVGGGAVVVLLLLLLRTAFSLAVLRLDFEKRWYVVTDRSLRVREGVMTVREMTVTFANIQNVAVMQGPIQRALGLADLQVETAGGGAVQATQKQIGPNLHVAWFRGIANAEEVKVLIQERLGKLKDTGLGDQDDRHDHAPAAAVETPAFLEALRAVHAEAAALRAAAAR